eukprot:SAG11_NODE_1931_length_4044_cov_1.223517_3_plen_219_part_00
MHLTKIGAMSSSWQQMATISALAPLDRLWHPAAVALGYSLCLCAVAHAEHDPEQEQCSTAGHHVGPSSPSLSADSSPGSVPQTSQADQVEHSRTKGASCSGQDKALGALWASAFEVMLSAKAVGRDVYLVPSLLGSARAPPPEQLRPLPALFRDHVVFALTAFDPPVRLPAPIGAPVALAWLVQGVWYCLLRQRQQLTGGRTGLRKCRAHRARWRKTR